MARFLLCLSLPCLALLGLLGGCAPGGPGFSACAGGARQGASCAKPAPPPAPYCTRSLADVDCWRDPRRLADRPPQVADGGWQAPALGPPPGGSPGGSPGGPPGGRPGGGAATAPLPPAVPRPARPPHGAMGEAGDAVPPGGG